MKNHKVFRFISLILSTIVFINCMSVYTIGENLTEEAIIDSLSTGSEHGSLPAYHMYLNDTAKKDVHPLSEKILSVHDISNSNGISVDYSNEMATVLGASKTIVYEFTLNEEGYYSILVSYIPLESKFSDIFFSMNLDGDIPFDEASVLKFKRIYKDKNPIMYDSRGNAIKPEQIQAEEQCDEYIKDVEGIYSEPLSFYFTKGQHTLKFDFAKADISIKTITLKNPQPIRSYNEYFNSISNRPVIRNGNNIVIEAEEAYRKSDSILYPIYDRSDPATSKSDPRKLILNTIGGNNWRTNAQWISWQADIPENGFYKLSFRSRQNMAYGITSYRSLFIDNEQLFEEMSLIKFPYGSKWENTVFGEDEPYKIYLTQGVHEIKLQVVLGHTAKVYNILDDVIYDLNSTYRRVIMITGTNPDRYIDYKVHVSIPDLLFEFERILNILEDQKSILSNLSDVSTDNQGLIQALIVQLDSFIKRPSTIPYRLSQFTTNIASLSAWLVSIKDSPLELDTITLTPENENITFAKSNWIQNVVFKAKAIIGSFYADYQLVGDYYDEEEAITVWVGMGREQAELVKSLVDNVFVPDKHIKVNINLVQQGLIEATLAGKGPDIAIFVGASDPVNLGVRGALVDLSEFSDYHDTVSQFQSQALIPFMFENHVYALPITQVFPMMFYRTDIFDELNIKPPDTWDEFYQIASTLQRNNLNIGVGADISTFATLLFQKGGSFYNDNRTATRFEETISFDAFSQWTDFYTKYSIPLAYDLQTRFRNGEMPLAIASYSFYNQLQVVAPELNNLWKMVMVPGTVKSDGSIDHSVCGGSAMTGAILFSKTKSKEKAWEFLKWFASTDIQVQYGLGIEMMMGPSARHPTANVKALQYLPWSPEEQEILYDQWELVKENAEIPASYYINRNINNAFRLVINSNENPRHTLNQYNYEMNKEIKRKRAEFNLP
ncbi:MAG: extracellular solute-binding protein [Eubacteriales bacterium]|nr:extracellular solute-binding protein [Eubacteriales bacterium]